MKPEKRYLRANRIAHILDSSIRIPGTNWTIGWDPIIGLIPGGGDVAMLIPSAWIVVEAARAGVGVWSVIRMLFNLAIELLIGSIPVLGDLFDAWFKANERNIRILGDRIGIKEGTLK